MEKLPAINLDAKLIPLVHDYLNGISLSDLAFKYNLPENQVSEFLERREVKSFIKSTLINSGYVNKKSRIELLNSIVSEKIQFSEENDVPLTKKDLLDVLKLLREEEELILKNSEEVPESQNVYVAVLNELKSENR